MSEESAVKVCVRVRPLIAREESADSENAKPVQLLWKADKNSINLIDDGNSTKNFNFDRVFTADETTGQLYQDIAKPLVVSSVEGYNGTIFAYGQTSSGKTFTMMGSDHKPGVIPLAVEDVFHTIKNCPKKEFLLRVSYMEIYNETVTDLLVDSWKRKPLEIRETLNKNVYVADLTEELVTSPAQALAWIRKGEKNRHYGKTKMNQRSSRSHAIFRMILESRERSDPASGENADAAIIVSHLNLVDLAGSERASQTGAEGTRFKEGCNINRSLFTLGQVMKKLTDENQKGFTNYRDSKLTRILQNSLGGNAKTVIICTVTPVALDETLSTLQFASTAKKMRNDPHVTEVSDDGALLKRYRNEIVDLKRRLHEMASQQVSSVTQTTATEKEVLSQLLMEKDQLQREQEDRIKNLTTLLVTSSNLASGQKRPKRRVTWGGKMLRLARPSAGGPSDLSFADPFCRKRKADRSCLTELGEDDEDFDCQWEIPDETPDEMEMSHSSVTVRSFQDSPKDFLYEERMRELSGKVSHLELQLEVETQQRDEAKAKVADLELQLQAEAQQKREATEQVEMLELKVADLQLEVETQQRDEAATKVADLQLQLEVETQQRDEAATKVADLQLQLQAEAQQKREATDQAEMLELKVADLQLQLDEQRLCRGETDEQMRGEFAEAVNLCETLSSEKETALSERDSLRQQLALLTAQNADLEAQNAALSLELKERRDLEEFESLEQEFRKEHQDKLQNEISSLKKTVESSEVQRLDLQNKVEALSAALKKKSDFAEELQTMSGKDLVQEVATLRRSLDDAEGLSRDTKKEWAVLRSRNIALEETVGNLTASHQELDAELDRLRLQLETEKTRYRNMQSDLQKELNVAFDDNTKLTTLLDGKVPKHLADSVELERAVANLSKELTASREAEAVLRAQLEDLASPQALQETVDSLTKQVCELTGELSAVQTQRDGLLSASAGQQQEAQRLGDALQASRMEVLEIRAELSSAAMREEELSQQRADLAQQLESSGAEKSRLTATAESTRLKLEESERHGASLEEKLTEMQQLMEGLEEKLADSENSRVTEEEISKELQEQLDQLTEELQVVRAEREQNAGAQSSAEQMEDLLSAVASVSAERDQLRLDLQMAAETQGLLQTLQDDLQEQRQKNCDLVKAVEQRHSDIQTLSRQLQSLQEEKETLLMATEEVEVEASLSAVASLTAERDQLRLDLQENVEMMIENQEELRTALEKIREQKEQIKRLQTSSSPSSGAQQEELHTHVKALTEQLQSLEAERDQLLSEQEASCSASREQLEALQSRAASLGQERDQLQEALQGLRQEKQQLRAEMEDRMETIEQLQASLQAAGEQKSQLENDLQCNMETAAEAQSHLHSLQQQLQEQNQRSMELDRLSQEGRVQLEQQVAETRSRLCSVEEELREQELKALEDMKVWEQKDSDSQQQVKALTEQLQSLEAERDQLLSEQEASCSASREQLEALQSRAASLGQERDQLQEALQGLRQEKQQLRAEMETLQTEMAALQETSSELKLTMQQQVESAEREAKLQQQLLRDANRTTSALREQLSGLNQSTGGAEQTAAAQLQDSAAQLQEILRKFQHFIDTCSKYNSSVMDKALSVEKPTDIRSLPKPTMSAYGTVCQLGRQTVISLGNIMDYLQVQAQVYMNLFEELVKKDLAVFEERRLQDVLLCRAQAPRFSIRDQDLHSLWEQRLTELLDKRQLYLQKMLSVSQKLWADMAFLPGELSAVISERERFEEQLQAALHAQPVRSGVLDGILSSELERRSAVIRSRKMALQGITDSHNGLCEELKQLETRADAQLREEQSKSSALLQPQEGATPKTEPCLLNDHQQLILKLQRTEEQLRALCVKNEQLEAAQAKSSDRLSSHKHATQLLQTELQDSRAEVEEKENIIRALRSQLSGSEKKASPAAAELEKLRTQVFRMEVELSSASDTHQQEIQRMTTLLSEKEESLRRLKESLRTWQQGDESFLQGEDLHARLTNPRGLTISSTVALEKARLEEEVRQLKVKVTALESSVSGQQAEVSKWRSRAVKLKARSQTEADKPSPPCTPTKRGPPMSADSCNPVSPPRRLVATPMKALGSPRRQLDSPKLSLLDSPKSRFFDAGGSSELLSQTYPRQFFDNSSLGTIPDAALGPQVKDCWPPSPKEDVCRTQ